MACQTRQSCTCVVFEAFDQEARDSKDVIESVFLRRNIIVKHRGYHGHHLQGMVHGRQSLEVSVGIDYPSMLVLVSIRGKLGVSNIFHYL